MKTRNDLAAELVNRAVDLGLSDQPGELEYPVSGLDCVRWSGMDMLRELLGGKEPLSKGQLRRLEFLLHSVVTIRRLEQGDELVSIPQ